MSRWGIVDQSLEGRQAVYFPHWSAGKCPRWGACDPATLARYRQRMWSVGSEHERRGLRRMCAEDLLFYITTFVNIFARTQDPRPIPFLPYDYQQECFTVMWKCMHDGQEDVRAIKPRKVGFTYMVLILFEHAWHFQSYKQFLLGSRRAEECDGVSESPAGNEGIAPVQWAKLLPKIDFVHLHQPSWLLPNGYQPREKPYRTHMRIANPENGSLIEAESANPDWGRGGGYYATGFDEHANTQHAYAIISAASEASECHFWWSTPAGPSTAFAMLGRSAIRQIRIEWWMDPTKAEGMTFDPEAGDRSRKSPWLERASARLGNDPVLLNNEIWADESQSGGCYYHRELFDMLTGVGHKEPMVRGPLRRGELDFAVHREGPRPTQFIDRLEGRWQLWCHLDSADQPPTDEPYIIAADVAAGSVDMMGRGASNSTIVVIGEYSGAKIAEYATHGLPAHTFAQLFVAAAYWFRGVGKRAYMIWDAGGSSGGIFTSVVWDDYQERENVYTRTTKKQVMPGYIRPGKAEDARAPWGEHVKMLWEGRYLERSYDCVQEMRFFNHNPNGGQPIHSASQGVDDPSGARENHGDRMTATVLACMVLSERLHRPQEPEILPPRGSPADMRRRRRERRMEVQRI